MKIDDLEKRYRELTDHLAAARVETRRLDEKLPAASATEQEALFETRGKLQLKESALVAALGQLREQLRVEEARRNKVA